jgi:hypothetical protein
MFNVPKLRERSGRYHITESKFENTDYCLHFLKNHGPDIQCVNVSDVPDCYEYKLPFRDTLHVSPQAYVDHLEKFFTYLCLETYAMAVVNCAGNPLDGVTRLVFKDMMEKRLQAHVRLQDNSRAFLLNRFEVVCDERNNPVNVIDNNDIVISIMYFPFLGVGGYILTIAKHRESLIGEKHDAAELHSVV